MVWHPFYVEALATRYFSKPSFSKYHLPLHDANFNVTAVTNNTAAAQQRYVFTPTTYGWI
ncbi:MAG: hypothetical protein IT427_15680 [Pirellulales bacterium]|nr:hypothetical protein [Pirellulales bacterium]